MLLRGGVWRGPGLGGSSLSEVLCGFGSVGGLCGKRDAWRAWLFAWGGVCGGGLHIDLSTPSCHDVAHFEDFWLGNGGVRRVGFGVRRGSDGEMWSWNGSLSSFAGFEGFEFVGNDVEFFVIDERGGSESVDTASSGTDSWADIGNSAGVVFGYFFSELFVAEGRGVHPFGF